MKPIDGTSDYASGCIGLTLITSFADEYCLPDKSGSIISSSIESEDSSSLITSAVGENGTLDLTVTLILLRYVSSSSGFGVSPIS